MHSHPTVFVCFQIQVNYSILQHSNVVKTVFKIWNSNTQKKYMINFEEEEEKKTISVCQKITPKKQTLKLVRKKFNQKTFG